MPCISSSGTGLNRNEVSKPFDLAVPPFTVIPVTPFSVAEATWIPLQSMWKTSKLKLNIRSNSCARRPISTFLVVSGPNWISFGSAQISWVLLT